VAVEEGVAVEEVADEDAADEDAVRELLGPALLGTSVVPAEPEHAAANSRGITARKRRTGSSWLMPRRALVCGAPSVEAIPVRG
jgi:hypothetical protein